MAKPRTLAARLAVIRRRVAVLERTRISQRADINRLQIQVYDLTSRIDALERKEKETA